MKKFVKWLTLVLLFLFTTLILVVRHSVVIRDRMPPQARITLLKYSATGRRKLNHDVGNSVKTIVGSRADTEFQFLSVMKCPEDAGEREWSDDDANEDGQVGDDQEVDWLQFPESEAFVRQGFLDIRSVSLRKHFNYLKIFAFVRGRDNIHSIYCTYPDSGISVEAQFNEVWISYWNSRNFSNSIFHPQMINCPVPKNVTNINMRSVFLSSKPCTKDLVVPVRTPYLHKYLKHDLTQSQGFCICVKPLFYEENISRDLIEWIETNRILGANKFVFYIYHVHPKVLKVLEHYATIGVADLIPWRLPGDLPNTIVELRGFLSKSTWQKRRSEILPYNDCFYKNMYGYKFVIPIDLDEIIVPVLHNSWAEVMEYVNKEDPMAMKRYGSFSVRNAYFFRDINETAYDPEADPPLNIAKYQMRSANFSSIGFAVKSIVNSEVASTIFNHYPLTSLFPNQKVNTHFSPDLVQMNHYREDCPEGMPNQCRDNFKKHLVKDDKLKKFFPEVSRRVEEKMIMFG